MGLRGLTLGTVPAGGVGGCGLPAWRSPSRTCAWAPLAAWAGRCGCWRGVCPAQLGARAIAALRRLAAASAEGCSWMPRQLDRLPWAGRRPCGVLMPHQLVCGQALPPAVDGAGPPAQAGAPGLARLCCDLDHQAPLCGAPSPSLRSIAPIHRLCPTPRSMSLAPGKAACRRRGVPWRLPCASPAAWRQGLLCPRRQDHLRLRGWSHGVIGSDRGRSTPMALPPVSREACGAIRGAAVRDTPMQGAL